MSPKHPFFDLTANAKPRLLVGDVEFRQEPANNLTREFGKTKLQEATTAFDHVVVDQRLDRHQYQQLLGSGIEITRFNCCEKYRGNEVA